MENFNLAQQIDQQSLKHFSQHLALESFTKQLKSDQKQNRKNRK